MFTRLLLAIGGDGASLPLPKQDFTAVTKGPSSNKSSSRYVII
jgi:hypothetical protein